MCDVGDLRPRGRLRSREKTLSPASLGRSLLCHLSTALPRRGGARTNLPCRTFGVELEQPREDLGSDPIGPSVTPGFLLVAPLLLVDVVVEEELAGGCNIAPPVCIEYSAVHRGMQL